MHVEMQATRDDAEACFDAPNSYWMTEREALI